VIEAAIQQFYELRDAPEIHVPSEPDERDALEPGCRIAPAARADRIPQRGEKRGFVDLANRNAALAYQTRFNQTQRPVRCVETLHRCSPARPAAPHRVLRHLDDSGQRHGRVDGRVEDGGCGGEYRKFRIRARGSGLGARARTRSSGSGLVARRIQRRATSHERRATSNEPERRATSPSDEQRAPSDEQRARATSNDPEPRARATRNDDFARCTKSS